MKFFKIFIFTFFLTELVYPRPLVTITHLAGEHIVWNFPPFGIFNAFTKIDFVIVLLISCFTTATLLFLQRSNNQLSMYAKEKWWFFLILWVFFMTLFSLGYIWYGVNVRFTGGIE